MQLPDFMKEALALARQGIEPLLFMPGYPTALDTAVNNAAASALELGRVNGMVLTLSEPPPVPRFPMLEMLKM